MGKKPKHQKIILEKPEQNTKEPTIPKLAFPAYAAYIWVEESPKGQPLIVIGFPFCDYIPNYLKHWDHKTKFPITPQGLKALVSILENRRLVTSPGRIATPGVPTQALVDSLLKYERETKELPKDPTEALLSLGLLE